MAYNLCEEEVTALHELLALLQSIIIEILLYLETIIKK
jgi:hypothetical protein